MKSFSLIFRSCCWLRRCWNFSFPIQHRHFTYQIVSSIQQQQRRSLAIFISISSRQLEHLTDYEARHNRCHQRRRTHQHSAHHSVSRSRSVSLDLYISCWRVERSAFAARLALPVRVPARNWRQQQQHQGGWYLYIYTVYVCEGGTLHSSSSSSLIMLEDYIFRRDEFSDCLSLMRPCRLFLPHFTWFQFKSFSSSSSFLSLSLALPMSRKKTSIDELSTFSFRQTAATARCALIALMALFVCVFVALSSLLNKQDYFHKCLHPNDNFIFALHVSTNNYN